MRTETLSVLFISRLLAQRTLQDLWWCLLNKRRLLISGKIPNRFSLENALSNIERQILYIRIYINILYVIYTFKRVYHDVNPTMIDSCTPYKHRLLEFWNAFSLTSSVIKSISDNIYTQNKSIYFKENKCMWYLPTIIVPLRLFRRGW